MKKSWSKLNKQLEEDFLCVALRGRVRFFYTKYSKSLDGLEDRFAVLVDKNEMFKANSFNHHYKYRALEQEVHDELSLSWKEAYDFVEDVRKKNLDYSTDDVHKSLLFYKQNQITTCLDSDNPIVRMFAILDRRVGKRTLLKLKEVINNQPEWLQYFYKLRLDAENIAYK